MENYKKEKEEFLNDLSKLFVKHHISQITSVKYIPNYKGREVALVEDGDRLFSVDITADSEIAILHDIIRAIW